ncbi:Esterase CG5412 [Durusdinium trenchii]|uniref:Esterase CG5412 n=1 Tax=Durusdinium trenchii TaxID=1381693 RepID=A0ABP0K3Y8_9DINO|eukprot:g7336.t2
MLPCHRMLRLLALHGFGGTFGALAPRDLARLAAPMGAKEIICLIAPNRHASGIPAWFSGDQSPAGRYNGWSLTEQRWAELAESTACATGRRPPPLVPEDLPPADPWADWSDEGFHESWRCLEEEWRRGNYDGLIGFSQGALMSVLFTQLLSKRRDTAGEAASPPKLLILCGGFAAPSPPACRGAWPPRERLKVPSFHLWGRDDPIVANLRSRELADLFHQPCFYEHQLVAPNDHKLGSHTFPWPDGDTEAFKALRSFMVTRPT